MSGSASGSGFYQHPTNPCAKTDVGKERVVPIAIICKQTGQLEWIPFILYPSLLKFCQYPLKIETFIKDMGAQNLMPKHMTGYLHAHLFKPEIRE